MHGDFKRKIIKGAPGPKGKDTILCRTKYEMPTIPGALMKAHGIQFLSTGAILACWLFTPNFAKNHGAEDFHIGLIFVGYGVAIFVSNLIFGRLSDNHGRKPFLIGGLFLAALFFALQGLSTNLWMLFATRALAGFTAGIFPSALIAYVHEAKKKMGRFSSMGSMGWGAGVLMGGLVAQYLDLESVYFFAGGLFFLSGVLALKLPNITHTPLNVPLLPWKVIKKNRHIYLSFLIRHSGANSIWVIFPLFLEDLGANMFWVGAINAINAFGQTAFMATLGDRIDPRKQVTIGLWVSMVCFFLFALVKNMWEIMPLQVLLAFSWACLYVGSIRELTDNNRERATSVGVFSSMMSLSMIFGAVIGTIVVYFTDYRGTLIAAGLITMLSIIYWHVESKKCLLEKTPVIVHP